MIRPDMEIKALEFTQIPLELPFFFILQFFQLLWHLPKTTHYLCFFGGYHSVLPVLFGRIFGKRCTIQAGGADCVNMPEIGYGNFRKKWLRKATRYSFENCSLILPVAKALVRQDYRYDPTISSEQGLLNLIPGLKTPIEVIPNGFDTGFWKDLNKSRNPRSFISVATGTSKSSRAIVKGYDLIERLAEKHPDWSFTLVGDPNYQSSNPNVKTLGKKQSLELLDLFNMHLFYLQLSTSEGFPNSLGEAMACGCIPVGSAVGAIPEIIGESGAILKIKDFELLELELDRLFSSDLSGLQLLAAKRIQQQFSFSTRKKLLLDSFRI